MEEHCGGFGAAEWEESDVVDDEHGGRGERLHFRGQVSLDRCPHEGAAQVVGGAEVAAVAGLDRECCECDGEVGLAAAGLAEKQNRPVLFNEPQGRKVLDEFAVDRWLELVVEVVDAAPVGELGVTQTGGEAPVSIRGCLIGDEAGEELDVGPVLALCFFGKGGEHAGGGVQLEVAEVGFDLFIDTHADASTPSSPPISGSITTP